jgi:hypothetical protein
LVDAADLDRLVLSCSSRTIDVLFRSVAPIAPATADSTSYQLYYGNATPAAPPANRNEVLYPGGGGWWAGCGTWHATRTAMARCHQILDG